MSHTKHPHAHEKLPEGDQQVPYWKRVHHDWKFWVAIVLMLVAMATYILTLDLSIRPAEENKPQSPQQVQ